MILNLVKRLKNKKKSTFSKNHLKSVTRASLINWFLEI